MEKNVQCNSLSRPTYWYSSFLQENRTATKALWRRGARIRIQPISEVYNHLLNFSLSSKAETGHKASQGFGGPFPLSLLRLPLLLQRNHFFDHNFLQRCPFFKFKYAIDKAQRDLWIAYTTKWIHRPWKTLHPKLWDFSIFSYFMTFLSAAAFPIFYFSNLNTQSIDRYLLIAYTTKWIGRPNKIIFSRVWRFKQFSHYWKNLSPGLLNSLGCA